jgi:hypothetical protein
VAVEDLLVAADPDRHFSAGGAGGAAADRRVEHVKIFLGEGGVDLAHHRHRIGRHVEEGGVGTHALDQPAGPERHLFDIGRDRQRGEDDLALCAGSGRKWPSGRGQNLFAIAMSEGNP